MTNVFEKLVVGDQEHILTSQRMRSGTDYEGFQYLEKFVYDDFDVNAPAWTFCVDGHMPHAHRAHLGKNTFPQTDGAGKFADSHLL